MLVSRELQLVAILLNRSTLAFCFLVSLRDWAGGVALFAENKIWKKSSIKNPINVYIVTPPSNIKLNIQVNQTNNWKSQDTTTRWWFLKYCLCSSWRLGKWSNLVCSYFSNGLVQLPTRQFLPQIYLTNEKHPGCLGYTVDEKLPRSLCSDYNQPWHKDPYSTTEFFLFSWLIIMNP